MMDLAIISTALILGFLVLRWDVYSDYKRWKQDKPIFHGKGWRLRAALLSPSIILFAIPLDPQNAWQIIFGLIVSTGMVGSLFMLFFNGWFNNIRRFNWWYGGTDDPDDAWFDNLWQNFKLIQVQIGQIGLAAICTTIYLIKLF